MGSNPGYILKSFERYHHIREAYCPDICTVPVSRVFFHFRALERKLVCASKRRALANEVFQMIEHLHLHHTTFFLSKEKLEDENSLTGLS